MNANEQRIVNMWRKLVEAWVMQRERAEKGGDTVSVERCTRQIQFCRERAEHYETLFDIPHPPDEAEILEGQP